jgi:hypothetical protein
MADTRIEQIADDLFRSLRTELRLPGPIAVRARREAAVIVSDLAGRPSYWLVPVASDDRLVGFLRLSLDGRLHAWGRFGQGEALEAFPPLSVLSRDDADRAIHEAFASRYSNISTPELVHDGPVDRIAWCSLAVAADGTKALLFWSFGEAYSRPA